MKQSPPVPLRALKAALGLGAAAAASLAFAGAASAAVTVITPDVGGSDHLTAAINAANTSSATSNTIVLSPGVYQPLHQPITITKNLNIVADHSFQAPPNVGVAIEINGAQAALNNASQNLFQINSGVSVRMDGFNLDAAGSAGGFAGVQVNGNLTMWGVTMDGPPSYGVTVAATGTATLNESTINSSTASSLKNAGTLTLNNSEVVFGAQDGIDNQSPGKFTLNNTIMTGNGPGPGVECVGGVSQNGGPGSLSDDASCGVQHQSDASLNAQAPLSDNGNGGPATTVMFAGPNSTTNAGVNCPTTDERFFVNPVVGGARQCDIGPVTNSATQQTAAPTCGVSFLATDHSSQQVTLADTASGVGPEPGPGTDNPSNTVATAYPPAAAVPVPGYSVDNLQISNGTVAFSPFTSPSNTGLVLTATKTTAGTATRWSFTGLNWAGISKNCF